jgi:hypothetical protein
MDPISKAYLDGVKRACDVCGIGIVTFIKQAQSSGLDNIAKVLNVPKQDSPVSRALRAPEGGEKRFPLSSRANSAETSVTDDIELPGVSDVALNIAGNKITNAAGNIATNRNLQSKLLTKVMDTTGDVAGSTLATTGRTGANLLGRMTGAATFLADPVASAAGTIYGGGSPVDATKAFVGGVDRNFFNIPSNAYRGAQYLGELAGRKFY